MTLDTSMPVLIDGRTPPKGIPAKSINVVRLSRTALSQEQRSRLEELAFEFGNSPESYFATELHGECLFWNDGAGATSLEVDGRNWHVAGGLLVPQADKAAFLKDLAELVKRQKIVLSVYSINELDRPLFESHGFQVTKFGEEPVVDLADLNWSGKAYEWVRRQSNYCRRQGLAVREIVVVENGHIDPAQSSPVDPLWPVSGASWKTLQGVLAEIQVEDLSGRAYEQPLRLMEGQLCLDHLYRRKLFVVVNPRTERVEAFCQVNPMSAGREWGIEMYRQRKDAVRGVIPFLLREVIDRMQHSGAEHVSLCLVPGRGLESGTDHECLWARWMLILWRTLSPRAFNVAGQEHFKTRFRPRFRSRYMAITPRASLATFLSFLKTSGALDISPWKFIWKSIWHTARNANHRCP